MTWKIVADSGSNILEFTLPTAQYESVPLMINIGTNVYMDNKDLNPADILHAMELEKTASSSACPSPDAYAKAFEGADNIICFTISSNLSGSYNSATLGKELFLEHNPNVNIHIFDTLSAGAEMDLLVYKAFELVEKNPSFDEMVQQMTDYHRNTHIAFILESVDNLVKNGRLNKIVGSMIGLLGIRLIGVRSQDGKLELATKAKGTKRALKALLAEMEKHGYNGGKVVITHAFAPANAEEFKQLLLQSYPNADTTTLQMNGLCCYYAQRHGMLIGYERQS